MIAEEMWTLAEEASIGDAPDAWMNASLALAGVGEGAQAAQAVLNAILTAKMLGRDQLFDALGVGADLLSSLDNGQALSDIHNEIAELDQWLPGVLASVHA
jgi:hypothetical protein